MKSFLGQRPDEHLIFDLRRHPAVLFRSFLGLALSLAIPFFVLRSGGVVGWRGDFLLVFFLLFFLFLIRSLFTYFRSCYILTDQRLIKIEQKDFFHQLLSEVALDKVQETTCEIKGPVAALFDFGDVVLSLYPANEKKIVLEAIEEPKKVQQQINNLVNDFNKQKRAG